MRTTITFKRRAEGAGDLQGDRYPAPGRPRTTTRLSRRSSSLAASRRPASARLANTMATPFRKAACFRRASHIRAHGHLRQQPRAHEPGAETGSFLAQAGRLALQFPASSAADVTLTMPRSGRSPLSPARQPVHASRVPADGERSPYAVLGSVWGPSPSARTTAGHGAHDLTGLVGAGRRARPRRCVGPAARIRPNPSVSRSGRSQARTSRHGAIAALTRPWLEHAADVQEISIERLPHRVSAPRGGGASAGPDGRGVMARAADRYFDSVNVRGSPDSAPTDWRRDDVPGRSASDGWFAARSPPGLARAAIAGPDVPRSGDGGPSAGRSRPAVVQGIPTGRGGRDGWWCLTGS